jgi:transforming growth factor-beta-induced protein
MKTRYLAATLVAASLFVAACGSDENDAATDTTVAPAETTPAPAETTPAAAGDIVAVASSTDGFSTLVAAVTAAGLVETLQGAGPFTVFAPTDEAFAALPEGVLDALLLPENKETLAQILTYHVVSGKVMAADVTAGDVPSVEGSTIAVTVDGGKVMLNGSANVVATDVAASNGVIHVIDAVILPPGLDVSTLIAPMTTEGAAEAPGDIVEVASTTDGFSTLVAAVTAAGLVETLQGEGPFTVFAPTDEAFAALPAGILDALLLPENKDVLVQILTYHVVSGKVMAADVAAGDVPSVEGSPITVTVDGGKVMLNGSANVVATDVAASNGVIHVIDAVILPPGLDVSSL